MQSYKTLEDISLVDKRVLIREDLNVPLQDGIITNDTRIQRALPTIERVLAEKGTSVVILSHLGRPKGKEEPSLSLKPVATRLEESLKRPVRFEREWITGVELKPGEVVLCENVRFLPGETKNDEALAKQMAALCDVFVMDAFATAHRAQSSTEGVAKFAKEAVAGPLLDAELKAIQDVIHQPKSPVLAIVGGAKVSTKMGVLANLLPVVDKLIVGGGIANTFLAAAGHPVGASLFEPDWIDEAKRVLELAKQSNTEILFPSDVIVASEMSDEAKARCISINDVQAEDKIFDIGPKTIDRYCQAILASKTILWNGPVGVFEMKPFMAGTSAVAKAVVESEGYSVAGGGDTISAIETFGIEGSIDYISTGGGAFLEMLEGKTLPGVSCLSAVQSIPA